jgi:ribonuclease-3
LNGKPKSSLFEAVTAAIYLDGGYQAAKQFIFRHGNLRLDGKSSNPIGDLKEYLEHRGEKQAVATVEKFGKDHSPIFYCTLNAMGEEAKGEGKTIKEAQATASVRLLWELKNKYGD